MIDVAAPSRAARGRGRAAAGNPRRPVRAAVAQRGGGRWLGSRRGPAAAAHRGRGRAAAQGHHPQHVARHRVRPVDQSLPRLRAWLHLLLRPAEPRLSRPVAGARFRDPAGRAAGGAATCWRRSCGRRRYVPRRSRSGPTPIPTSRSRANGGSCARCWRCWRSIDHPVVDRDQGHADRARHRHPGADGGRGAGRVGISVTTLDRRLARAMEPRVPAPARRLATIERLAEAGIPVRLMVSPVVPALTDHEIEAILAAGAGGRGGRGVVDRAAPAAGGGGAVPRLAGRAFSGPRAAGHGPGARAARRPGLRPGLGPADDRAGRVGAAVPRQRFEIACRRLGWSRSCRRCGRDLFRVPPRAGDQLSLF